MLEVIKHFKSPPGSAEPLIGGTGKDSTAFLLIWLCKNPGLCSGLDQLPV